MARRADEKLRIAPIIDLKRDGRQARAADRAFETAVAALMIAALVGWRLA
jgi:hypothetical protein